MKIDVDFKKYNVFFEKEIPVVVELKEAQRISKLINKYKDFENIPNEEIVNIVYLIKKGGVFVLTDLTAYEVRINTLNRPGFLRAS